MVPRAGSLHSKEMTSDSKFPTAASDKPGDRGDLDTKLTIPQVSREGVRSANRFSLCVHFPKSDALPTAWWVSVLCWAGYLIATEPTGHFRSWQDSLESYKMPNLTILKTHV